MAHQRCVDGDHWRAAAMLAPAARAARRACSRHRPRHRRRPRQSRVRRRTASSATARPGRATAPLRRSPGPRPRDFTAGKYKIRSTETGSCPTDDDLLRSVRQGLYGTSMPGWESLLSDDDIRDVVDLHQDALAAVRDRAPAAWRSTVAAARERRRRASRAARRLREAAVRQVPRHATAAAPAPSPRTSRTTGGSRCARPI